MSNEAVFDLTDEQVLRMTNQGEEIELHTGNQTIKIRTSDYYVDAEQKSRLSEEYEGMSGDEVIEEVKDKDGDSSE